MAVIYRFTAIYVLSYRLYGGTPALMIPWDWIGVGCDCPFSFAFTVQDIDNIDEAHELVK